MFKKKRVIYLVFGSRSVLFSYSHPGLSYCVKSACEIHQHWPLHYDGHSGVDEQLLQCIKFETFVFWYYLAYTVSVV